MVTARVSVAGSVTDFCASARFARLLLNVLHNFYLCYVVHCKFSFTDFERSFSILKSAIILMKQICKMLLN